MVLPFIAGSNFKLLTSLYSTKNFSFLDACTYIEEAHPTYAPNSSTLDVTCTLGFSLFFTKNFLYSIKNFSFRRMHKFDTKCLFSFLLANTTKFSTGEAKQFAVTTSTGLYMTKSTNVYNYMYRENRQLVVAWEGGFFFFLNFVM
jgi:hypothetical protein